MSFDKEKARRNAEKNLSQGKIQAAIKDYCAIVENDPKDFSTLNTLGDLYVRMEAREEAIICFTRIAEHYNTQGFAHKAIAMFKKILRLKPDSVEISAKLAPLYQMLGLVAEARSFYLVVAEHYQKKGDQMRALETWSKIADLDPNDTATRLRLADNYLRENLRDQAAEAFAEAGNRLLAKKQIEQAAEVFAKALELRPLDLTALSGATSSSIALGLPDEAAERLEEAFALYPESSEILSLLAHAHLEAGNGVKAEEAVATLVERDPMSYKRYLDVAQVYLKNNDSQAAARVLGFCGEMLITNNQEEDLLQWVKEVLARDPEQITALKLLVRIRAWQRNEDELKTALEQLAESAQFNNEEEEERGALIELATLFPEDERYVSRLRELGTNLEAKSETKYESANGSSESVPTFESFHALGDEFEVNGLSPNGEKTAETQWDDNGFEFSDSNSSAPFAMNNFGGFSAEKTASFDDYTVFQQQPPQQSAQENTFDFVPVNSDSFATNGFELIQPDSSFDFQVEQPAENSFASQPEKASNTIDENNQTPAAAMPADPLAQLEHELESVDFYISQDYTDLALETLTMLESQYGAQPGIIQRLDQIGAAQKDRHTENEVLLETASPPSSQENSFASAAEKPTANIGLQSAAETNSQTGSSGELVIPQSGFEDLFAELGDDLEVANLGISQTADYETHYNLGLAYKEMGLWDDAVEEFQNAVKMVSAGDGTPRFLQCCHLIGHCFMEKDMPKLAVIWYQRGLDAPGHTEDEYQALRYELATAYERANENDKALELFAGIYAVNVAYRNVGEKVKSLQMA